MKRRIGALVLATFFTITANADDFAAVEKLDEAIEVFQSRELNSIEEDFKILKTSENLLNEALGLLEDGFDVYVKYDILVQKSLVNYIRGEMTLDNKSQKIKYLDEAFNYGSEAVEIDKGSKNAYAEAYYFKAISLGRKAEAEGPLKFLARKGELFSYLETAMVKKTRLGLEGLKVDGNGPDRVLGRVYYVLPGFAGGSTSKSLEHLERAYKSAYLNTDRPNGLNAVYYSETLIKKGNSGQKTEGCSILKSFLAKDPYSFNDIKIADTKYYQLIGKDIFTNECL